MRARPSIRDVQSRDLRDTSTLLKLHEQAASLGIACGSEAGRLEFVAMAERARRRGRRPGALFFWLLRERKGEFITQVEEDEAARRLREHREGPAERQEASNHDRPETEPHEDVTTVRICVYVARQHRIDDPYRVAYRYKGWTRQRWEQAWECYESSRWQRVAASATTIPDR